MPHHPPSALPCPGEATVSVFASPGSWIESAAVEQCRQVAALEGMVHVAAMPDLHPGKGAPIGAAMASTLLYPHLVGSDIGCGIAVFPLRLRRVVPERLARRFPDLDRAVTPDDPALDDVPDDARAALSAGALSAGALSAGALGDLDAVTCDGSDPRGAGHGPDAGLGTVGRGNHFVEVARIETVLDEGHAGRLGLARDEVVLIVHSGSRGLGERILRSHTGRHGAGPAPDPAAYLAVHDAAVRWASLNRRVIAARVARALGAGLADPVVDRCHNLVEVVGDRFLHRKGAAPGDGTDVLVAGSRGTRSYLVAAHAGPEANYSVAHGAGRKMSRADALRRGRAKHTVEELRRTPLGSFVVCGDRQLLFEEAPSAYKRIEQVVADLDAHGLATAVCATVPLVTYKTAEPGGCRAGGRR